MAWTSYQESHYGSCFILIASALKTKLMHHKIDLAMS